MFKSFRNSNKNQSKSQSSNTSRLTQSQQINKSNDVKSNYQFSRDTRPSFRLVISTLGELNNLLNCKFNLDEAQFNKELIQINLNNASPFLKKFENDPTTCEIIKMSIYHIGLKLPTIPKKHFDNMSDITARLLKDMVDAVIFDKPQAFDDIQKMLNNCFKDSLLVDCFKIVQKIFVGFTRLCFKHLENLRFVNFSNIFKPKLIADGGYTMSLMNSCFFKWQECQFFFTDNEKEKSKIESKQKKKFDLFIVFYDLKELIVKSEEKHNDNKDGEFVEDKNLLLNNVVACQFSHFMMADAIKKDNAYMKQHANNKEVEDLCRRREQKLVEFNNFIRKSKHIYDLIEAQHGFQEKSTKQDIMQPSVNRDEFVRRLKGFDELVQDMNKNQTDDIGLQQVTTAVLPNQYKGEEQKVDQNSMYIRSNRCAALPLKQYIDGKYIETCPEFSEYTKCLGKNLLADDSWSQLYESLKQQHGDVIGLNKYLFHVQLLSNSRPWANLKLDLNKMIQTFKEKSTWKIGELLCDLLLKAKIPDPQIRLTASNCSDDDSALTVEGINRRLFKITSIEAAISSESSTGITMKCLPGEQMPIISGYDLRNDFFGKVKIAQKNDAEARINSIKARIIRMCNILMCIEGNNLSYAKASEIVDTKLGSIDTTQKLFKLKFKDVNDQSLTVCELMNRMTCRQILAECMEELENMAKLRSLMFNITKNKMIRSESGEEPDEYVDVEKLITVKRSEYGIRIVDLLQLIDSMEIMYGGRLINCKHFICERQLVTQDYISKTYGPICIHMFRKRISADKNLQKYHVVYELNDGHNQSFSKCFVYNPYSNDVSMKDECTLLHLAGTIDRRTIIYHALDCYVRNSNLRKSDMFTSLEFAVKEYKNQFTCWSQLINKWKDELLCQNSSDALFAYYMYLMATDPNPHIPSLFLLFHAPNRQTPIEIMKCCNASIRPAEPQEAMKGEIINEFLQFIADNLEDLFDVEKLNKLNDKISLSTDEFSTTSSSNESVILGDRYLDGTHLATCIVSKDEKFKVYNNTFKDGSGNLKLQKLIDWFQGKIPIYLLVSKSNVKSMREIYIFDAVTSIGASIETKFAQIISKSLKSDLIMKEKGKSKLISEAIREAKVRVSTSQSGNILVFEGDGTKYNQHMHLEMFSLMYQSINDKMYGQGKTADWKIYMDHFYNYYRNKQMIVDLTKFRKDLFVKALQHFSLSDHKQLPKFSLEMNKFILCCFEHPEMNRKIKNVIQHTMTFTSKPLIDLVRLGRVKQEDVNYCQTLPNNLKHKMIERLMCPNIWAKSLSVMDQCLELEFVGKHLKDLINELSSWISSCFVQNRFEPNLFQKNFMDKWVKFTNQHLVVPSTYGMAQGILACSSSVFSSLALQFVVNKLKMSDLIDWGKSFATSDDMLLVMTTKKTCSSAELNNIRLEIETILSSLNIKCNEIKSSIHVNPDKLVFNSLYYYINLINKTQMAKLDEYKMPAIGRYWKNLFDEGPDEPCVTFNKISTNLKLLFDSFKYTKWDRLCFIENGRAISNSFNLTNYFYGRSSHFIREFHCSWPSSHENISPTDEFTYFNRKEIDLLWYVYMFALKVVNKVPKTDVQHLTKITFSNFECDDIKMDADGAMTLHLLTGQFVTVPKEYLETSFVQESILNVQLSTGSLIKFKLPLKVDDLTQLKLSIGNRFKQSKLYQMNVVNRFIPYEQVYSLFLSIYGWNFTGSNSCLGFRINVRPMKTLRREMHSIASIRAANVNYTPHQMFNFISHLGDAKGTNDRFAIRFKLIGTPHINDGDMTFNYRFGNFKSVDSSNPDYFKIKLTNYVRALLQLNPNHPMVYGYLPDETTIQASSMSAYDQLILKHELGSCSTTTEYLDSLLIMKLCHSIKFMKRSELITGMIAPFIEGYSFGGFRNLPEEGQTVRDYMKKGQFYDPWIVCQQRAKGGFWKHCGLLHEIESEMWYFLQGNKIKSRFVLERGTMIEKPIAPSDQIPVALLGYEYEPDLILRERFIVSTTFSNGKWQFEQQRHKLAKQRCVPMFTFSTESFLNQLTAIQRERVMEYLNKGKETEEQQCEIRFVVK